MTKHDVHLGSGATLHLELESPCEHLDQIDEVKPSAQGCEDCLAVGDRWFHLRLCRICGYVGCCDTSKNRHATAHFHATQHPIIESFQPDENWMYCYPDDAFIEQV